jgi:hypothetical protein
MPKTITCETHGEGRITYVCSHLAEESHGLGFHSRKPTKRNPFPDAWCDDCEVIYAAHGGWTDEAQELVKIQLLCSECYRRTRIRNTKPASTLDDLANLQWKCGSCEDWHTGPMLDIGFSRPHYWSSKYDTGSRSTVLPSGNLDPSHRTFLDSDYCAINEEDFFVRGIIHLPIVGSAETFRWGVWGSLSRANFEDLLRAESEPSQVDFPDMFSWLSSRLPDYPDTLSLKMWAEIREPGIRPNFRLEDADHPLAKEFHEGISPERVKEIMFRHLPARSD